MREALRSRLTLLVAATLVACAALAMGAISEAAGAKGYPPGQHRPDFKVRTMQVWRWPKGGGFATWAFPVPRHPGYCGTLHEDSPGPTRPLPVRVAKTRLTMRFQGIPDKPKRIRVWMWRSVDEDGNPEGNGVRLAPRGLKKRGTRRWHFHVKTSFDGERYFTVLGRWRRNEGCGPRIVSSDLRTVSRSGD